MIPSNLSQRIFLQKTSMEHIPVLLKEVITNLEIKSNGNYVDLTLGRAGHSKEILKQLKTGHLYAFDQDIDAINYSGEYLKQFGDNFGLGQKINEKMQESERKNLEREKINQARIKRKLEREKMEQNITKENVKEEIKNKNKTKDKDKIEITDEL